MTTKISWALLCGLLCTPAAAVAADETPVPVGALSREEIEAAVPGWVAEAAEVEIDRQAARSLAAVPEGARVVVYLGTWCPDSRREVSRFWRVLDETGGLVPFTVEWVGVDRDKEDPGGRAAAADVRYVPTFVVERQGREVGRVVEEAPHAIETDLLALLGGTASGVLTGSRPELVEGGEPGPEG